MKIIKIQNNLTVVLNSGNVITDSNCTDEKYNDIIAHQNDEEYVVNLLQPKRGEFLKKVKVVEQLIDSVKDSKYLKMIGSVITIPSISDFSVPQNLATKIIEAELDNNKSLIDSYLNFWTLSCLNPDSRVRNNLFWFLDTYGMEITSSGLFVAYRNVDIDQQGKTINHELTQLITEHFMHIRFRLKKAAKNYWFGKDEEGNYICKPQQDKVHTIIGNLKELYDNLSVDESEDVTIFTDHYSKTFQIKIGEMVTMPRKDCDLVQENDCSAGLHVGGKSWLKKSYFGDVTLRVLVNPTDVVAVPHKSDYGKMRTCAYLPIQVVSFDSDGNIIADDITGFEENFFNNLSYDTSNISGESQVYEIQIPKIIELNKENISKKLDKIKQSLSNKSI